MKICTSRTTSDTTQKLMKHKQRFEFFTLFWLAITYNRKLSYLIIHFDVLYSVYLYIFQKKSQTRDEIESVYSKFANFKLIFQPFLKSSTFFSISFLHRHWRFTGQQGKGGDYLLFHSTTSTRSRTLRHLFFTLHVRWLSRQTATRWDLPPYRITIWVIDWWCNVCLFTWWIDTRFLLLRFDIGNRWISTRIDYNPCITSEPTNQHSSTYGKKNGCVEKVVLERNVYCP